VKIEIGKNLCKVLESIISCTNDPSQIEVIMKSLEKMHESQKTYTCSLCGNVHYIGEPCIYDR